MTTDSHEAPALPTDQPAEPITTIETMTTLKRAGVSVAQAVSHGDETRLTLVTAGGGPNVSLSLDRGGLTDLAAIASVLDRSPRLAEALAQIDATNLADLRLLSKQVGPEVEFRPDETPDD